MSTRCAPAAFCSLSQLHVLWYSSASAAVAACVSAVFFHPWPRYAPIPSQTFVPVPEPLKIVLWADFIIFFYFAMQNYFGDFKPDNYKLAANAIGRTSLWNSDMVNGCGGILCMWIFGGSLWEGAISIMDIEILFLAHALWYGQLIAMMPPHPGVTAVLLSNPHTYLYIATVVTAWHLVR
jgi:hypothetical protein